MSCTGKEVYTYMALKLKHKWETASLTALPPLSYTNTSESRATDPTEILTTQSCGSHRNDTEQGFLIFAVYFNELGILLAYRQPFQRIFISNSIPT